MDKRTVVVTGGKRGIGAAICAAFLERGCQVVAVDKDFAGGLARDGEREGLYTYQADISQPLEVASFAQTMEELGPIHVLVNNAGYGITKPLEELTVDEWDAVLNTEPQGCLLNGQVPAPLKAGERSVINIASTRAASCLSLIQKPILPQRGHCSLNPYLSRILRAVWHRVNCISPGWIETNPEAVLTLKITASTWWETLCQGILPKLACTWLLRGWVYYSTNLTIDGGKT